MGRGEEGPAMAAVEDAALRWEEVTGATNPEADEIEWINPMTPTTRLLVVMVARLLGTGN